MEENKIQELTELFEKYGWHYSEHNRAFQRRFDEVYVHEPKCKNVFVLNEHFRKSTHVWLCFYFGCDMTYRVLHDELRIHQLTGNLTYEVCGSWDWSLEELENKLIEINEIYSKYCKQKKIKQIIAEGKSLLNFNTNLKIGD